MWLEFNKKNSLKNKTKIIPIDSEHFSIFKLLESHKLKEIKKFILLLLAGLSLSFQKNNYQK